MPRMLHFSEIKKSLFVTRFVAWIRQAKGQKLLVVLLVSILISGFGIYKLLINSESALSPKIDKAIAFFYEENQNRQVLEEVKKIELENPDKTNMIMCQILKAAAYWGDAHAERVNELFVA